MRKIVIIPSSFVILLVFITSCAQSKELKISVEEYQDKVYASWLAQCIGNIYGLPHENKYIDEPGPETFPYGYSEDDGDGDFTRTYEIATRCGDDADCNPATAGGVLATMKGYKNMPEFWKQGLAEVEPIDFKYTTISLNDAYELSFKHALEMIKRGGGQVSDREVTIKVQKPKTVPLEVAFEGHWPREKISLGKELTDEIEFEFEGIGFAVMGSAEKAGEEDYVFEVEMYIDGKFIETAKLPTNFVLRRFTPFWRYQLAMTKHEVRLKMLNPTDKAKLNLGDVVVYGNRPFRAKY